MKLGKIAEAYETLKNLPDNDIFTEQNHFDIFMLMRSMRSHVEFADERVTAIKQKYKEFADEEGRVFGKQAEDMIGEIDRVYDSDVKIDIQPIDLPFVPGVNYKVMCALENFVNFHMH